MAVQMKTSMRSDFMISDAAMPQRMAELDKEQELQMAQFAKILGDIGNSSGTASDDTASDIQKAISDLEDSEKFEKALKALDSELRSRFSSAESGKGNDGVYRNKSTGEELPADTYELAKMVVKGKLDIRDIPDGLMTEALMNAIISLMIEMKLHGGIDEDEPKEEIFDPALAAVNEQNYSREVSGQMLSELYKIIEKHNEAESEDNVTILDGISEPTDESETLASAATGKVHVEEQSEEGIFEQIIDNLTEDAAQIDGTPVIQTQAVPTANETQNAVSQAVAEGGQQAAQTVQQSGQSDNAQMRFDGQTQKSGEVTDEAAQNEFDNVIESFTVKEADASAHERTESAQTTSVPNEHAARVQSASEELEMLKNAKLGKGENKPAETTAPLISDQPIVFARADGTEIEVKPTEIVDQTMKIIEKAIEETKEQSEYSLVLNPEEVGRITVKLIKAADGAITVTIAAENAHTQRVLEQHSELMQNNLRNSGINLESWQTVNESRQETYAQDYNGSSKNPYFRRDDAQNDSDNNEGDRTFADIIAAM